MAASGAQDLAALARMHEWNLDTVRTWDKRRAVPDDKLAQFAARHGVTVGELLAPAAVDQPTTYRSSGQIEGDSFTKRLATAMDIVEAGLAASAVDATKVPRAEMAAAVFRLLPWPIPWVSE